MPDKKCAAGAAESPSCDPPTVKRRERDTTSAGGIRCKRSRCALAAAASVPS